MAEDRVARERVASLEKLLLNLWEERRRAVDKFEESVAKRFTSVNDFRGALSDLAKDMATRRELEQFHDEYRRAHSELSKDVANLRSRVDTGPAELHAVARETAVEIGRREGTQILAGAMYALVGLLIGMATFAAIWFH